MSKFGELVQIRFDDPALVLILSSFAMGSFEISSTICLFPRLLSAVQVQGQAWSQHHPQPLSQTCSCCRSRSVVALEAELRRPSIISLVMSSSFLLLLEFSKTAACVPSSPINEIAPGALTVGVRAPAHPSFCHVAFSAVSAQRYSWSPP